METPQNKSPASTCRECSALIPADTYVCHACRIVAHGLTAFWAVVAAAYPEIASGDGDDRDLRQMARKEIEDWVSNNSVTCDECERNCTVEGVRAELRQSGNGKRVLCEHCLSKIR